MPAPAAPRPLDIEIDAAFAAVENMIGAYLELNDKRKTGEVHAMMYDDLIEFANFRLETATSVMLLAQNGKLADALGLCRSLLEHSLLLRLQCRGNRYFHLRYVKNSKRAHEELAAAQAELDEGESLQCLYVDRYPRSGPPRLMWVFEGLKASNDDGDDDSISVHYFEFQRFRPEVMRLDDSDYLDYMPRDWKPPQSLVEAKKRHKAEAEAQYQHYLSWPALLTCLSLNGLAADEDIRRIEAHYTFLGRFLHPTQGAARDLHEKANFFNGKASIGLSHEYTKLSVLLTALYCVWLVRGVLLEVADLLDSAPPRYIREPGTGAMRDHIELVPRRFSYFWFIDNEAPLWDKFNHAVYQSTDEELAAAGHYSKLSSAGILFDKDIYSHLRQALGSWSNDRAGSYEAPF
jgi:hypothetical protein